MQTQQPLVVTGRITRAGGKSAAEIHVAVIAARIGPARGGDLTPPGVVLAETTTDQEGNYPLSFANANSKTHRDVHVIARKEGAAIAWKQLNLVATEAQVALELLLAEPIRGQLVDLEGQPAAGVQLQVQTVMQRADRGVQSRDSISYRGGNGVPAAWLPAVTSDDGGRFALGGVPAGYGVFLKVVGSDRFAPQDIALNTGLPEQRGEHDGTYRPLFKNVEAGAEAVLPLAPVQIFEGVVTYEDTGQPAPHARLTIWASQEEFGSMVSVPGTADENGRYRISPKPGIRFGVTAYPPEGVPYLARDTPHDHTIRWQDDDISRQVNLSLPRGVVVRGNVVEMGSSRPVAGAAIQYVPEEANNPNTADDIITGWQGAQLANGQGEFGMVVLPGPGRLLVDGPQGKYVLQEIDSRQLSDGKPGGRRNYVHAVKKINPSHDAGPINVTIGLTPGASVAGRMVDENGQPIDEALVISRLIIFPLSLRWEGPLPTVLGGRFELSGLEEGKAYPVHFLDAKRRLGATALMQAGGDDSPVVLKPCGQATARFVDSKGQPCGRFQADLNMVVTPGALHIDLEAARRGELLADADFIENIDRTNYRPGPETDDQGNVTFPALIPGAIYQLLTWENEKPKVLKQFTVQSGAQLDLGDLVIGD